MVPGTMNGDFAKPGWATKAPAPAAPAKSPERIVSDKAVGNVIRKSGSWTPIA